MPNLDDRIGIRGDLRIAVIDAKTGQVLRRIDIRNKIMFQAADLLVSLLAQRAVDYPGGLPGQIPNDQIYTIRMGTGSTAPLRTDTNLVNPVFGFHLDDAHKVTAMPGELQFLATMGTSDGNGNSYQEAGLFTKGATSGVLDLPGSTVLTPRMFARQVHPAIPKTNAISLQYSWTIAFTA